MEVFIRGIPPTSTRHELKQFVQKGMRRWLPFGSKPVLVACNVIKITDEHGETEYHGLVEIKPEKAAHTLIRRLNGKLFKGRAVEVRPFYPRTPGGRRNVKGGKGKSDYKDRRWRDRRRADLRIEKKIVAKLSVPYKRK